jgi:hypothetical protein
VLHPACEPCLRRKRSQGARNSLLSSRRPFEATAEEGAGYPGAAVHRSPHDACLASQHYRTRFTLQGPDVDYIFTRRPWRAVRNRTRIQEEVRGDMTVPRSRATSGRLRWRGLERPGGEGVPARAATDVPPLLRPLSYSSSSARGVPPWLQGAPRPTKIQVGSIGSASCTRASKLRSISTSCDRRNLVRLWPAIVSGAFPGCGGDVRFATGHGQSARSLQAKGSELTRSEIPSRDTAARGLKRECGRPRR